MNYKLVEKEAFTVLEKVEPQEIDDSVNKNSIPAFWERSHQDGTVKTLLEKQQINHLSLVSAITMHQQIIRHLIIP